MWLACLKAFDDHHYELIEVRFREGMVLAHQHLGQLGPAIPDAVFGDPGTIMGFRVGAADGAFLAREFAPTFSAEDFISLARYHMYIRLWIDGDPSKLSSAITLPPPDH